MSAEFPSVLPKGAELQKNDPGMSGHDTLYLVCGAIVAPDDFDPGWELYIKDAEGGFDAPYGTYDTYADALVAYATRLHQREI